MKYKIFRNKRAIGIDDAIPVIVIIFVVAIMFMLFKFNEHSKEKDIANNIQNQKDIIDGHEVLVGYLTKTDSSGKNNADLLMEAYLNKDDSVKSKVKDYFSAKLLHLTGWEVQISDSQNKVFFSVNGDLMTVHSLRMQLQSQ